MLFIDTIKFFKIYNQIKKSNLFDEKYYLDSCSDINLAGIDPLMHYIKKGWKEGRNPCVYFNVRYYLKYNVDVAKSFIEPFSHYLTFGWKEGRSPNYCFDVAYYLNNNVDVANAHIDPLIHYVFCGWKELRKPNLYFDIEYYMVQNNLIDQLCIDPLKDYLLFGYEKSISPNRLFDINFYLSQFKIDVLSMNIDPLSHYVFYGWKDGKNPCSIFDTKYYLASNSDVRALGINPLSHYLLIGHNEQRAINTFLLDNLSPYPFESRRLFIEDLAIMSDFQELLCSEQDSRIKIGESKIIENKDRIFTKEISQSDDLIGGQVISDPGFWIKCLFHSEDIFVNYLHDAVAFGGLITNRFANYHSDGQLVITKQGGLLSSSFGIMDGYNSLPCDLVRNEIDNYKYLGLSVKNYYDGGLILIGNLHIHFGHFLLEGLSKLYVTELRWLLNLGFKYAVYEPYIMDWGYTLLERCGINKDQIVHIPYDGMIVEKMIVPDRAMCTHHSISSMQALTWNKITSTAKINHDYSTKVYLSRRKIKGRRLINEEEIEFFFVTKGYQIIYAEDHTMDEQINIAANAKYLAGAVGSQMYLAAFQQSRGRNFIFGPVNFYLQDDLMIAEVKEHFLKVVLGSPINHHLPPNEQSWSIDLNDLISAYSFFENEESIYD